MEVYQACILLQLQAQSPPTQTGHQQMHQGRWGNPSCLFSICCKLLWCRSAPEELIEWWRRAPPWVCSRGASWTTPRQRTRWWTWRCSKQSTWRPRWSSLPFWRMNLMNQKHFQTLCPGMVFSFFLKDCSSHHSVAILITCCHITRGQRSSNVGEPHRQHLLVAVKFVPSYRGERSPNGDSFLGEAMQSFLFQQSGFRFHHGTQDERLTEVRQYVPWGRWLRRWRRSWHIPWRAARSGVSAWLNLGLSLRAPSGWSWRRACRPLLRRLQRWTGWPIAEVKSLTARTASCTSSPAIN